MKRRHLVAAAALAPAAWPLRAQAAYPSKPIRLIVGSAPARADVKAKVE
jgi:tripartite-type tricarboxylate transporter receptor subunit TctC